MINLNYLIIWYLVGFISTNLFTYILEKEITVKDVLFALFFGFFGLIATLIGLIATIKRFIDEDSEKIKKILDKKLF